MGRSLIAGLLVAIVATSVIAAPPQRPITNPKFDPDAKQMGLFEALAEGVVEAKMIPKSSLGGNLILANKSPEPITVEIPAGFVGVPISAQFGGGGGFGQGGGGLGQGGQQGGQGGGQQAVGGGGQGQQQGGIGGGGGGGNQFFSIPAERSVLITYKSVCLEHGKTEPNVRMQYAVIPVEQYTENPVLQQVIKMVAAGRMDVGAAQAATWHIANGMSWDELANKTIDHLAGPDAPYFTHAQLLQAQQIVAAAEHAAKNAPAQPVTDPVPAVRQTIRTAR